MSNVIQFKQGEETKATQEAGLVLALVDYGDFWRALKAYLPFVSKDPLRDHIGGICLREHKGSLKLIATNGHILGEAVLGGEFNMEHLPERGVTIPYAAVKQIIAQGKPFKRINDLIKLSLLDGNCIRVEKLGDWVLEFALGDSPFPDTDRVKPFNYSYVQVGLCPHYLKAIAEAAIALEKGSVQLNIIEGRTDAPIGISLNPYSNEFDMVIMPKRF